MKLIKSAIVYKAEIPASITTLHNHLSEQSFAPPMALQLRSVGFVPVNEESGCSLATSYPGGVAFRVRVDEKVIPSSIIKAEVDKIAESVLRETGRKPGKKHRAEIKDEVMVDLAQRALVRTVASVTCFYHNLSRFLIVATTSKKIANICISLLIKAVGSVKTETIHISEIKHGLTTRLNSWVNGDLDAFGAFSPADQAALADTEGRKLAVKMGSLQIAREGLSHAIQRGFTVTSLGFVHGEAEFRLTDDFRLKGLSHIDTTEEGDAEDLWASGAADQVATVVKIVNELVELLSYKEGEENV